MTTKYEEQMYNDIHRIANALEKLAKSLENPLNNQEPQRVSARINLDIEPSNICPYCGSINIRELYKTVCVTGNTIHYVCSDCHKEFDV